MSETTGETPLDPAAIMAAHENHYGACQLLGGQPKGRHLLRNPHCEPYRLAAALAAAQERLGDVYEEGWDAADDEASAIYGTGIPSCQDNPYRAALAGEGAAEQPEETR